MALASDEEDPSNAGEEHTASAGDITAAQPSATGDGSHDDTADDTFQFSQNPPMEHDPPFRPAEGRFCSYLCSRAPTSWIRH